MQIGFKLIPGIHDDIIRVIEDLDERGISRSRFIRDAILAYVDQEDEVIKRLVRIEAKLDANGNGVSKTDDPFANASL